MPKRIAPNAKVRSAAPRARAPERTSTDMKTPSPEAGRTAATEKHRESSSDPHSRRSQPATAALVPLDRIANRRDESTPVFSRCQVKSEQCAKVVAWETNSTSMPLAVKQGCRYDSVPL